MWIGGVVIQFHSAAAVLYMHHLTINIMYPQHCWSKPYQRLGQPHSFRDKCLSSLSSGETIEKVQLNFGCVTFNCSVLVNAWDSSGGPAMIHILLLKYLDIWFVLIGSIPHVVTNMPWGYQKHLVITEYHIIVNIDSVVQVVTDINQLTSVRYSITE